MDKRTRAVAFAGIMAAGAFAVLALGRLIPTGQLGFAALASIFVAAAVIDCGAAWGIAVWAVSSTLGLTLLAGSSVCWMFTLFFGLYPVIKLLCEKRLPERVCRAVKLLTFYAGIAAAFILIAAATGGSLFDIPATISEGSTILIAVDRLGAWIIPVAVVGGGVVFVIYDIGYSKLVEFYRVKLSRRRDR